jgi:transposase InsO family protein
MARPRRVRTTDSRPELPVAPNLLDRNFIATASSQIWLADITYSAPRSEKSGRHMFGMH